MSYQVYFGDLTEENQALILTLLRLKDEAGQLSPDEQVLLVQLRGTAEPTTYVTPEPPGPIGGGRRGGGGRPPARRGGGVPRRNGRGGGPLPPEA